MSDHYFCKYDCGGTDCHAPICKDILPTRAVSRRKQYSCQEINMKSGGYIYGYFHKGKYWIETVSVKRVKQKEE